MVDLFTCYVELQPLKDKETSSTLDAFGQEWIYRRDGIPSVVQTDKRTNIECHTIREICQGIGINKDAQHHTIHSVAGEISIRCMQVYQQLSKGS